MILASTKEAFYVCAIYKLSSTYWVSVNKVYSWLDQYRTLSTWAPGRLCNNVKSKEA